MAMRQVQITAALLLLASTLAYGDPKSDASDLKIVCYYSNWAVYRPSLAKFTPQNINPYMCTHLIYAFVGMNKNYELKPFDPYNDIEQGNYKKFVGLKSYNPKLKTMIAIGGWNEGSKRFSQLVANYTSRQRFVRSSVRFLREHGFDGLDLDWEYPGFRDGASDDDKQGYARLMKEVRVAFDAERVPRGKEKLLLSVAVPAGQQYIDKGFDVPAISKAVDFMNVLTYDYHTAYESETHHHAPLRSRDDFNEWDERKKLNVEWTIDYYLENGAPKHKLLVGIPTYGRSYTLLDPKDNELEAPTDGPGDPGISTREKGYLAYYEICQQINDDDWEVDKPFPKISGPYAYKDNQWVGYDDEDMIIEKARFILDRGLGGAMVWTLDNDDFRGNCGDEQSPLINTLRAALLANVVEGSSNHRTLARAVASEEEKTFATPLPVARKEERASPRKRTSSSQRRSSTDRKKNQNNARTTPAPPTTPDPGPAFECTDEGFFNNPRDCRKYFWCLDSGPANLGIVPHAFTCPAGLYFNSRSEACDYKDNVVCKLPAGVTTAAPEKPKPKPSRTRGRTTTTTTTTEEPETEEITEVIGKARKKGNTENLTELIRLLESLGGVDRLQTILGNDQKKEEPGRSQTLPSYVTPNRAPPTTPAPRETTTIARTALRYRPPFEPETYKAPVFEDDFAPAQQNGNVRYQAQRRPKFHELTTAGPLFNYVSPDRPQSNAAAANNPTDPPGFPFVYQTPDRTKYPENVITQQPPPDTRIRNGYQDFQNFFSYQTPDRTTEVTTLAPTEPPEEERIVYRVPIRVQSGQGLRVQGVEGGRRRARVRVKPVVVSGRANGVVRANQATELVETVGNNGGRVVGVRRRPAYDAVAGQQVSTIPRAVFRADEYFPRNIHEDYRFPFVQATTPAPVTTVSPYVPPFYHPPPTTTSPPPPYYPPQFYQPSDYTTLPPQTQPPPVVHYENDYDYVTEQEEATNPPTTTTTVAPPPRRRRPTSPKRRPATTTRRPATTTRPATTRKPVKPVLQAVSGPGVVVGNGGQLECRKRGMYRHPVECGQYVVCAPVSRRDPNGDLTSTVNHCPANHVFLQDIGRCMQGDKDRCESYK